MAQGQRPPKKFAPILNARIPTNKQEVRSFLGMVNYYITFIPNLSSVTKPLRELTQENDNFTWNESCQQSFETCKQILVSDRVLMLYNSSLPIVVSTDASPVGLGAVLSHQITVNGDLVEVRWHMHRVH